MKIRIFCLLLMICLSLPAYCNEAQEPASDTNVTYVNWSPYILNLEKKIKDKWDSNPHNDKVEIIAAFEIKKDGQIDNVRIKKSSGDEEQDSLAIKTLKDVSPVEPLPDGYTGSSLALNYTFNKKIPENQAPQTPAKPTLIDNFRKLNSDYYLRYQNKNPWL